MEQRQFPEFTEPDPATTESNIGTLQEFPDCYVALVFKARVQWLRDTGACLSPFNAFLYRIGNIAATAGVAFGQRLKSQYFKHSAVSWVNYPGLEKNPNHKIASKYLQGKYGAIIGFGIKGGLEPAKKFIQSSKLLSHLANIGDAKSLVIHPASTTHQQLTAAEQKETGVTEDYIRLSIGLENVEDLKQDIDQALRASVK